MASQFSMRTFLMREWPYLLILILSLFGVAFSSIARAPMAIYWVAMAPCVGIICIITRWKDAASRDEQFHLIWTQTLHWGAVLLAMRLMYVPNVSRIMNADASPLAALTVLALGTFTAGVHISSWPICLVGIILAAGVPAIAWLEQSMLLILLLGIGLLAVVAPIIVNQRKSQNPASAA